MPVQSFPPNHRPRDLVPIVNFLVRQGVRLAAFAINDVHGIDWTRICDGEIAKTAEPRYAGSERLAVELRADFCFRDVAFVKMKMLRDFEVAVTPGEREVCWRCQYVGLR